jgi:hypothetical protein
VVSAHAACLKVPVLMGFELSWSTRGGGGGGGGSTHHIDTICA